MKIVHKSCWSSRDLDFMQMTGGQCYVASLKDHYQNALHRCLHRQWETDPVDTGCKWVKQGSCVHTQFYSNVKSETCDITCVGGSNVCFSHFLRMRVGPCSCMCVHPRGPRALQRMSRGSGGVESVTQRGRWWDRTALQQWVTLQHQTQAGFEYCIRALELSPRNPEASEELQPTPRPSFWGKSWQSLSLSWPDGPDSSSEIPMVGCEPRFGWRVSICLCACVCVCKCDDMLGRCYCEERENWAPVSFSLSSGWPQSCILDQTQNHKAPCV